MRDEKPGSQQDAIEAVHRLFGALDMLKRQGVCGNSQLVDQNVAALGATLSRDFENWVISTVGFEGVFNRSAYLSVMKFIATDVSVGVSQHLVLDSIATLAANGKSADVRGRLLEFGRFRDENGVPQHEQSASDYSAIVVYENRQWLVKQYTEIGHIRWYPAATPSYTRNWCPPSN